ATKVRMESSSSAISTRGMTHPFRSHQPPRCCSCTTPGEIPLAEEAYVDIASFGRRRSQPRPEGGTFARFQHGLVQHRVPSVDLRALRVADAEAQPRQFDRQPTFADHYAFDHQQRLALHALG